MKNCEPVRFSQFVGFFNIFFKYLELFRQTHMLREKRCFLALLCDPVT
jgi:hypothetical protein